MEPSGRGRSLSKARSLLKSGAAVAERVWAKEHLCPTGLQIGSERVSGVWIRARKLEGELDVEQRRILRLVGESMSHCGTSLVLDGY
jgi:hypothetical protein